MYVYARGNVRFFLLVVVFVDMWLDKEFYLYIKLAYVCHLVVFSYLHISTWKKKWHLNSKILVYYAVVAANATILLLLLLLCVTASSFFFIRVYMWLRERDWWWCSEKKRKTSFFFLLTLFYSFSLSLSLSPSLSIVFDWCDIWRRRPISLFFLLSVGFYLFAKKAYSQRIVIRRRQKEKERDKIITYTIGTSVSSFITTSEQNDGREEKGRKWRRKRRRDEWGNHFLLLLLLSNKKNNTRWMNEWMNKK